MVVRRSIGVIRVIRAIGVIRVIRGIRGIRVIRVIRPIPVDVSIGGPKGGHRCRGD